MKAKPFKSQALFKAALNGNGNNDRPTNEILIIDKSWVLRQSWTQTCYNRSNNKAIFNFYVTTFFVYVSLIFLWVSGFVCACVYVCESFLVRARRSGSHKLFFHYLNIKMTLVFSLYFFLKFVFFLLIRFNCNSAVS